MSTINICDLQPVGSDLFSDSESYMIELSSEEELLFPRGGSGKLCEFAVTYVTEKIVDVVVDYVVDEAKEFIKEADDYLSKLPNQIVNYMMSGS